LSGRSNENILLGTCEVPLQQLATNNVFGAAPGVIEDKYRIVLAGGVVE